MATTDVPGYRLDASGREHAEDERLALLQEIYDPQSRARRSFAEPGWRCLEVGAGGGSLAVWLAERVGPTGEVVATDVDTRYLERLDVPNLRVLRHDILVDPLDTLGPGSFDLVSSRLMLFWLAPHQRQAVARMVECLRPGGWLIDEDGDWGLLGPVDPLHPMAAPHDAVYRDREWFADLGYDPRFGRTLPGLFEAAGLVDVRAEATTEAVRGGSPWTRFWTESLRVIAHQSPSLPQPGDAAFEAVCAPFTDPSVWVMRELLHACSGRRPRL